MARNEISSITKVGLEKRIDENFVELYTTVASASAAAAAASAAAAGASAAAAAASAEITAIKAAWTSANTTITAGSGTFTTVAGAIWYRHTGKTVTFRARAVITANGTASTSVILAIPVNASTVSQQTAYGQRSTNGRMLVGNIGTSSIAFIFSDDGLYPGADETTLNFQGTYETT